MIDRKRRRKLNVGMAVLANIRSQDVSRTLAGRISAVVATDAVANDVGVTECGGQPADG